MKVRITSPFDSIHVTFHFDIKEENVILQKYGSLAHGVNGTKSCKRKNVAKKSFSLFSNGHKGRFVCFSFVSEKSKYIYMKTNIFYNKHI